MLRQIVLDTETTGLQVENGHRLIEIGCIEMIKRRLTGRTFHCYLNPEHRVDPEALAIHGLTNDFLADKPSFAMIVDQFIEFITDAELIIHNATFDVGFLNAELQRLVPARLPVDSLASIVDTLVLARHKHPGQANNLDALCRRYQVDNSSRHLHGALIDAELLAHVYLRMTGGQTQLFAEERDAVTLTQPQKISAYQAALQERQPTTIILPTAEELSAHQEFLNFLTKEAGLCLWQDG